MSSTSIFVFICLCFLWKASSSSQDESIGRKKTIFFFSLLEGELDLQTALKDPFEHCAITKREEELVCGHRPCEMKWWVMGSLLFVGMFLIWARDRLVRVTLCTQIATVWCANLHSRAVLQPMKRTEINGSLWSMAACCSGGHLLSPRGSDEERYSSVTVCIDRLCNRLQRIYYPDIQ